MGKLNALGISPENASRALNGSNPGPGGTIREDVTQ